MLSVPDHAEIGQLFRKGSLERVAHAKVDANVALKVRWQAKSSSAGHVEVHCGHVRPEIGLFQSGEAHPRFHEYLAQKVFISHAIQAESLRGKDEQDAIPREFLQELADRTVNSAVDIPKRGRKGTVWLVARMPWVLETPERMARGV